MTDQNSSFLRELDVSLSQSDEVIFDVLIKHKLDKIVCVVTDAKALYAEEFKWRRINKKDILNMNEILQVIGTQNNVLAVNQCVLSPDTARLMEYLTNMLINITVNENKGYYYMALRVILETKIQGNLHYPHLHHDEVEVVLQTINSCDEVFKQSITLAYYKNPERLKHVIKLQKFWKQKLHFKQSAKVIQNAWQKYNMQKCYIAIKCGQYNIGICKKFYSAFQSLIEDYDQEIRFLDLCKILQTTVEQNNKLKNKIELIDAEIGMLIKSNLNQERSQHSDNSAMDCSSSSITDTSLSEIYGDINMNIHLTKIKILVLYLLPFISGNSLAEAVGNINDDKKYHFRITMDQVPKLFTFVDYSNIEANVETLLEMFQTYDNGFFSENMDNIFAYIGNDMRNRHEFRRIRSLRTQSLLTKQSHIEKAKLALQEKLSFYQQYRQSIKDKPFRGPFTRKIKRYSAQELMQKGILESIKDLPEVYMKNVQFIIRNTEINGTFEFQAVFMRLDVEHAYVDVTKQVVDHKHFNPVPALPL